MDWFARLTGFNIAERQVRHATERAEAAGLGARLQFRHGAAEDLPGIASGSVDRVMAIECAFYFDRPRFYARAADVLRPGGRLVLADIMFADPAGALTRGRPDLQRVGTLSANRQEWEKHFRTMSIRPINRWTRPGAPPWWGGPPCQFAPCHPPAWPPCAAPGAFAAAPSPAGSAPGLPGPLAPTPTDPPTLRGVASDRRIARTSTPWFAKCSTSWLTMRASSVPSDFSYTDKRNSQASLCSSVSSAARSSART